MARSRHPAVLATRVLASGTALADTFAMHRLEHGPGDASPGVVRRALVLIAAVASLSLGGGCIVVGPVVPHPVPLVDVQLVAVAPDLWVVADYPYSVYYVDGFFWTVRSNVWYRRTAWADPWLYVGSTYVPLRVRTSRHEYYRHYHPRGNDRVWSVHRGRPPPGAYRTERGRAQAAPPRRTEGSEEYRWEEERVPAGGRSQGRRPNQSQRDRRPETSDRERGREPH